MADTPFYIDQDQLQTGPVALTGDEALHAIRVLRMKEGDHIRLLNGMGTAAKARIVHVEKRGLAAVIESLEYAGPDPYPVHISIAPTKSIDRYEWFLEKGTEAGVSRIIPLLCEHSERRVVKEERSRAILVSAMKQSNRSWLPGLSPLIRFNDLITNDFSGRKYIAWCGSGTEKHLVHLHNSPSSALVLIGPEGDFTTTEVDMAVKHGFLPINLGPNRLRTETAALTAAILLNTLNQTL